MAKLYPPIIEGSLPAFYNSQASELSESYKKRIAAITDIYNAQYAEIEKQYKAGALTPLEYSQALKKLQPYQDMIADLDRRLKAGLFLKVNFSMNAAVSKTEVVGMILKIKRLQESQDIFTVDTTDQDNADQNKTSSIDWVNSTVTFDLAGHDSAIQVGNFYKIQIAFKDSKNKVGYYSNAGIVKYTSYPKLEIQGLDKAEINLNPSMLVGKYSQNGEGKDTTEKAYSYSFNILSEDFTIYATTGEKLHNSELDDSESQSSDVLYSNFSFEENKRYYIQYCVTTTNGIKASTPLYAVQAKYDYIPNHILNQYRLVPILNYDQGIIQVSLKSFTGEKHAIGGTFQILRSSSRDNFKIWYILNKFLMPNLITDNFDYEDNTVEHGITYRYAIQQFNDNGICSARIYSDKIVAKFEDIFLIGDTLQEDNTSEESMTSEGLKKRQLRIRFNPSISNYKRNLQEAKVDTLGNAYPFIFKNGQIKYRSFSVSGIVSYISDNEERFINHKLIEQKTDNTVDLTDENVTTERLFRDAASEWLENGNLKLFKSPTEGNMIVRLMNVTLTPEKAVGRMIYSFSATAYEMDEYSTDNLIKYQFLNTKVLIHKYRKSDTIRFNKNFQAGDSILRHSPAKSIKLALPETTPIVLVRSKPVNSNEDLVIVNKSQYYEISDIDITDVYFPQSQEFSASSPYYITYEYENSVSNTFSLITKLEYKDYPLIEMRGGRTDLLSIFQNKKVGIDAVGPFRFIKTQNYKNVYTYETSIDTILQKNEQGNYCVSYKPRSTDYVSLGNPRFYYRVYNNSNLSVPIGCIDGKNLTTVNLNSINNRISINNQPFIDLTNTESYQLDNAIVANTNPLNDNKIWSKIDIGDNITVLFGIKLIVNTYSCETATEGDYYNEQLLTAKRNLNAAVIDYRRKRGEEIKGYAPIIDATIKQVNDAYNNIKEKYYAFLPILENALKAWEE